MMTYKFTEGRFEAHVFPGAGNGRTTRLVELHRNGSGNQVAVICVDYDDLPDLLHVLKRAIKAHKVTQ